jgi:hypothetical protein
MRVLHQGEPGVLVHQSEPREGVVRLQAAGVGIAAGEHCHHRVRTGPEQPTPGFDVETGTHPVQLPAGLLEQVRIAAQMLGQGIAVAVDRAVVGRGSYPLGRCITRDTFPV